MTYGRAGGGGLGLGRLPHLAPAATACIMALALLVLFAGADVSHAQMEGEDGDGGAGTADGTVAVLETTAGEIVIEFFPDDAPNHVSNFVELAESGFYDGTLFHRIIPGFMIQGGDPNTINGDAGTWGTGGPSHTVDAEFNDIEHDRGIVSMARSQNPDSAGSQFFIVHQDSNFLDGQYTAFGRIMTESSFDTLDRIAGLQTGPQDRPADMEQARILSVAVMVRSDVPGALDLGPPERAAGISPPIIPPTPVEQLYDSEDLGISFMAPPGWFLQEPRQSNPAAPDVVAVGPQRGGGIPQIYVFVNDNTDGLTLDEIVDARTALIQESVSAEDFETFSVEPSTVAGLPARTLGIIETVSINNVTIDVRLVEEIVYGGEKYYALSYANILANFELDLMHFERMLETFEVDGAAADGAEQQEQQQQPPSDAQEEDAGDDGNDGAAALEARDAEDGGGCLIATAAFGSELEPRVQFMRELRDGTVAPTQSGAAFMSAFNTAYYSFSPAVADMEREHPAFREMVRALITPMIASLYIMSLADPGSELDVIMYGSVVIALNVGMYVAAPLAAGTFLLVRVRPAALRTIRLRAVALRRHHHHP